MQNVEASVLVAHSGKQHAYRHAASLQSIGRLDCLITSSYYKPSRWPDALFRLSKRADRVLQKRRLSDLDDARVIRRPSLEMPELWWRNVRRQPSRAEAAMFRRDADFDQWVAREFAAHSPIYWGFQGSCLESLHAAKNAGRIAVCEFATAHVTAAIRILAAEAERHPEWAGTISNFRFPEWYQQRLEHEPHAADFCVAASQFTKASLQEVGIDEDRIRLLPLGAAVEEFEFIERTTSGPLKVLFVGGIGQRKGIKYLLDAIFELQSTEVELRLLGPLPADTRPLDQHGASFRYLGRTDQAGVAREMQAADLLVLPSVFEGFGLVILEAMATGLPVIASTHTCAPDVINDQVDGFVLEADDVSGLAKRLDWAASHRADLLEMGRLACRRAQEFSWHAHAERLAKLLPTLS